MLTATKPPKCKHCKKRMPEGSRDVMHDDCIAPWWEANKAKVLRRYAAILRKAERAQTRARKKELQTIPQLIAIAQREFNAFIRERDKGQPCICCGRTTNDKDLLTGSRWDAGHYRSTGSASHLRFNLDNCHRQLVACNRHGAGRAVDYRIGLVHRIGLAAVEALEADNTVRKWTREELREIASTYRARLKAMKETT